jgi:hypothetical protein
MAIAIKNNNRHFFLCCLSKAILLLCLLSNMHTKAQTIKRHELFTSDSLLQITIKADFKSIYAEKTDSIYQKAIITFHFPEKNIEAETGIRVRGVQRRVVCSTPSLMLDFRKNTGKLKKLGKLKLVTCCSDNWQDEKLVLKEYLAYKIYNLLTQKSFRVRLLKINYTDEKKPSHARLQYAFFIEDTDDMAARNDCRELNRPVATEQTNREQMTLLAIFQYMIGNVDWAVPRLKNIKLIVPKNQTDELPFAVPYDFDYAGFVDAAYAIPSPEYNIETVRERLYRGFARKPEEISKAIDSFLLHKEDIYTLINNFSLLQKGSKQEMIRYLDEFYQLISNPKKVKEIFIDNARRQ